MWAGIELLRGIERTGADAQHWKLDGMDDVLEGLGVSTVDLFRTKRGDSIIIVSHAKHFHHREVGDTMFVPTDDPTRPGNSIPLHSLLTGALEVGFVREKVIERLQVEFGRTFEPLPRQHKHRQ